MPVIKGEEPISSPDRPPEERLQTLRSIAMTLSPMHPHDWNRIKAEYDEIEKAIRDRPVTVTGANIRTLTMVCSNCGGPAHAETEPDLHRRYRHDCEQCGLKNIQVLFLNDRQIADLYGGQSH